MMGARISGSILSKLRHMKTSLLLHLKGPKHEIFESGFFTQIRRLWLGDLGTGEKNELSKV
jgi:hypothetical protein